ncbi:MAG: hypothetical protein LKI80_15840 [Sporolactobacillus sp.]|jgi:hypothetical protein|nr:hypothetical protein [Sporolactobacillus sp.]
MKSIIFSQDKYKMNWLRPDDVYAKVDAPADLACKVENKSAGDVVRTTVTITNSTRKPFFTSIDTIGIHFPLEDRYNSSDICLKYRCHTHLFLSGEVSYIRALRMGGEPPHLGMVLTAGSLVGYSVQRELTKRSNDRGFFILHPAPMELGPGESTKIGWTIFPFIDDRDFRAQLARRSKYVRVEADRYVLLRGETNRIRITPTFSAATVEVNGRRLSAGLDGAYRLDDAADNIGERLYRINVDGVHTWCRTVVQEPIARLAEHRCRFIAGRQQYRGKCTALRGAYLVYDNEEHHLYYNRENDYNGGRERVGMGVLLAEFLQGGKQLDPQLADETKQSLIVSLQAYIDYVMRELVDTGSGEVYNDMPRDNGYKRLYNASWFATFFIEVYQLLEDRRYLTYACNILRYFYRRGGADFYPIELPALALDQALQTAGMEAERREIGSLFMHHADRLVQTGLHYPSSEVNFEQSIVAPAASVLLQVYVLTGKQAYLTAARQHLHVLEMFNGRQPDYHRYETAIRHWDGYWFGKRRYYGDTFPHYWSGLTGNVFALYGLIMQDADYLHRAWDSLRGVLPLFFGDGSASCAYVFPYRVNGRRASFYDPYANDQDWGLYFYLRLLRDLPRLKKRIADRKQKAEKRG